MARLTSVFCVLTIQALVLINNAISVSSCRPGWEEFRGSCYGYSQQQASYADAVALCIGHQAKLVEIETSRENRFVTDLARRNNAELVWIGGSDMFHEGTWQWISSGRSFSAYNNWKDGEPSDAAGAEECVHLWKSRNYSWNDERCGNAWNFICEQEI